MIKKLDDYDHSTSIIIIDNIATTQHKYYNYLQEHDVNSYIRINCDKKLHDEMEHYMSQIAGYFLGKFEIKKSSDFSTKKQSIKTTYMSGVRHVASGGRQDFVKENHEYTPDNTLLYLSKTICNPPELVLYVHLSKMMDKKLLLVTNNSYKKNFSEFDILNDNTMELLQKYYQDVLNAIVSEAILSASSNSIVKQIFYKLDVQSRNDYIKCNKDIIAKFIHKHYFNNSTSVADINLAIIKKGLKSNNISLFKDIHVSQDVLLSNIASIL